MTVYLAPKGLFPSPNPRTEAPKGALRTAKNVDILSPGVVTPRRGYQNAIAGHTPPAGYDVVQFIPFGTELYAVSTDGTDWTMRKVSNTATTIRDADAANLEFVRHEIRSEEAAQLLYFTTEQGVRKLSSTADTVANFAGIRQGLIGIIAENTSATNLPYASGERAAYRVVYYRPEATGQKISGPPSSRFRFVASVACACRLRFPLPPDLAVGDVAQIYRSTIELTDEALNDRLYLVGEHEITADNVTDGWFGFDDTIDNDELGAALYTNDDLETLAQSSHPPPRCKDLAMYGGSMFYANTRLRHKLVMELKLVGDSVGGIDVMARTGDVTAGSNEILNVSSTTNLRVGQYVTDSASGPSQAGTRFPANTQITLISGTTVTVSANATGAGSTAGYAFDVCDYVSVGSEIYFAWDDSSATNRTFEVEDTNEYHTTLELASVINERGAILGGAYMAHPMAGQDSLDPTPNNSGQIELEERTTFNGFQLKSSHPGAFAPELESGAANTFSDDEAFPARLYFSKELEQEEVPYGNFRDIGNAGSPILRILASRDSLFVFKEDGIFRVSGFNPATFSVTTIDRSLRLIHPEAATRVGDWVYAWTDNGIVRLSDQGTQLISNTPLRRTLQAIQSQIRLTPTATGVFAAGMENDGQVFFGIPATASAEVCERAYVFHVDTLAWTTHELTARAMAYHPGQDLMVYSGEPEYTIRKQRKTFGGTLDHADLDYSPTIASIAGAVVTIDAGSGWTPAVGDLLVQGANRGIITAITSATVFTIDDVTGFAAGAATAYAAFQCEVEFIAIAQAGPSRSVHYCTTWDFETIRGVRDMTVSFTSDVSSTAQTVAVARTRVETDWTEQVEVGIGRAHAVCFVLLPKLTIKQAAAPWALLGMELESTPTSIQVERGA